MSDDVVPISVSRLRELEALEASLAARIAHEREDAVAAATAARLRKLKDFNKAHPEQNTKRVMKHYLANKDEINAKRRAARAAKKLAVPGAV